MIKIIIQILLVFIAITWMAEMKISFRPFHIEFPNWRQSLAIIIICIGVGIYYNAAYRKGWNKAIEKVNEVLDQQNKER